MPHVHVVRPYPTMLACAGSNPARARAISAGNVFFLARSPVACSQKTRQLWSASYAPPGDKAVGRRPRPIPALHEPLRSAVAGTVAEGVPRRGARPRCGACTGLERAGSAWH